MTSQFKYGTARATKPQLYANMQIEHLYTSYYNNTRRKHKQQHKIWAIPTLKVSPQLEQYVLSSAMICVKE
jgi:hypothetical protein